MNTNAQNNPKENPQQPVQVTIPNPAEPAETPAKRSWLDRMSNAFSDAIQTSRGDSKNVDEQPLQTQPRPRAVKERTPAVEERRRKPTSQPQPVQMTPSAAADRKMIVPEGTTIGGSIRAANVETEIAGRVEGDITVEGRLFLGATAVVTGDIKAVSCRIEGLVEGKMECAQEIELARTGRLNSDVSAGKVVTVAGQVTGMIQAPVLRLASTGRIEGDVLTRQLQIEEGGIFNGRCAMKAPAQRNQG